VVGAVAQTLKMVQVGVLVVALDMLQQEELGLLAKAMLEVTVGRLQETSPQVVVVAQDKQAQMGAEQPSEETGEMVLPRQLLVHL
jgi:hypothetical protein